MAGQQMSLVVGVEPRFYWSGRGDLNARPPAPKAGALPGCATPRLHSFYITSQPGSSVRYPLADGGPPDRADSGAIALGPAMPPRAASSSPPRAFPAPSPGTDRCIGIPDR